MRRGAILLACLGLLACTSDIPPDPCVGWKPIRPMPGESARLSPELQADILEHNMHGAEVCGWKAS